MQAQIHDQLDFSDYRRELWLTQQTTRKAYELGLDLDELYREIYGLSISELAALSFAAHATAAGTPGTTFNPETWNSNGVIALPRKCIDAFFEICSVDYEKFKELAKSPAVAVEGYETYALSPLVRYPLVIRSDGLAVAPMLRDTLERPTRAFRIDVLQALGDRSDDIGRFNQAFGATYQDYVERCLRSAVGCGDVRRGTELLPSTQKNCDFICIEPQAATLVEVKSTWFSVAGDTTKKRDLLKREFARAGGVADGLIQLNESARMIRKRRTEIEKNVLLHGVLVLRGEQVMLNSPYTRELLEEIVLEKTDTKMIVKYHLVNDIGFAALVRLLADGGSLSRFLYQKRHNKVKQYEDFHHTVWNQRPDLPPHPLDHLGKEALDVLTEEYFPRIPPDADA